MDVGAVKAPTIRRSQTCKRSRQSVRSRAASLRRTCDALSPRMKVYLEGLTATHSGEHVYRATNVLVGRDDRGKVFPKASHPIIRTHPVTKRKALFDAWPMCRWSL
jgi:alpha-ketoglutarate-dependent taurine dioxygenase